MFLTSTPAAAESFIDRFAEIQRLRESVRQLVAGSPSWIALLGRRKIGKTSLILELERAAASDAVRFVVLDSFEQAPPDVTLFRRYALRTLDAVFSTELGLRLEPVAARPADFRAALQTSARFASLPAQLRAWILEIPERPIDGEAIRMALDLPERLAQGLGLYLVVAWDEFQEVAALRIGSRPAGRKPDAVDPLPLARSVWQRHKRVAYVIAGSARAMMRDLVTNEHSPFYQHFALVEIGPLGRTDAIELLVRASADVRQIPAGIADRAFEVLGGHPFHLQLLGETLTRQPGPMTTDSLKSALQELVFSRSGRLALEFENEFQRLVGRSTFLAATLQALATGPRRPSQIAKEIGTSSAAVISNVNRLGDAVVRQADGLYRLDDPTFGLWLTWRRPGGSVVPMKLLGDDAERAVVDRLARMGFDLVYQSRASRGAFDLLATWGTRQLGVQVKRVELPARFTAVEWARMSAVAERFGWQWVIAAVEPNGRVWLLEPARARRRRGVTLGREAEIANVLRWLEQRAASVRASTKRRARRAGPSP